MRPRFFDSTTAFPNSWLQEPGRIGSYIGYDEQLAHGIEAAADFFLMPSLFEPCGLNQLYSLKYGTLPIVRATGVLNDTVEQYDEASGDGTGFQFRADAAGGLRHRRVGGEHLLRPSRASAANYHNGDAATSHGTEAPRCMSKPTFRRSPTGRLRAEAPAFYDALVVNESAVDLLGNDTW